MLKYRHSKLNILATLLGIFILITFLQVGVSGGAVYAAAETANYDNTDVMADLESMTIGDNRFDAADYPANPEGSPHILAFVEYCYSYYADSQDNYALYVYVYNPAQLDIKSDRRNQIQFSAGNSGSNKYPLTLLSTSSDKLYYKFKVELTASEKNRILSALDNDGRTYDINGVELYTSGSNADDYAIEKLFTYSGYAAGYGADEDAASTLTCTAEGGTEVIPITAHHTTWYPEGSKPGNTDLQESLHSVYFAVPKEYDEKYDYLEAVKVQWLNARTIPVLVTGNSTIYSALQELNSYNSQLSNNSAPDEFDRQSFNYILATDYYVQSQPGTIYSYYVFNDMCFVGKPNEVVVEDGNTKELKTLFWFLPTDVMDYTDRADNYITPSSVILDSIQNLSNNGYFENDKAVAGKYPSYLFESWDNQFHRETIEVGKSYTLSSEIVNNGWWETFWGYNNVVDSDTFGDKAKAALGYYDQTLDGQLDSLFYVADKHYSQYQYSAGGSKQINQAQITEMLAALAIVDFSFDGSRRDRTEYKEFGIINSRRNESEVLFDDLHVDTKNMICAPLVQFYKFVQYVKLVYDKENPYQPWSHNYPWKKSMDYDKAFKQSEPMRTLLECMDNFSTWLQEMDDRNVHSRRFSPFNLETDDFSFVKGDVNLTRGKSLSSRYKGWACLDDALNGLCSSNDFQEFDALTKEQRFMELFYKATL